MIQKTIAIVGGGISSLSLALKVAQRIDFKDHTTKIKIFEKSSKLGGRIIGSQPQQDSQHRTFNADVGANYIDYENEQQQKLIQANLPQNLIQNIKPFQGKFLIYENSKLIQPQQQKTRYFYQGGFVKMAQDWKKQIQNQKTLNFTISYHQVQKIQKHNGGWKIIYQNQKQEDCKEMFDILIFGTTAFDSRQILIKSGVQNTKDIVEELRKFKYTKQLSVVLEVEGKQLGKSHHTPYSILMKNQPLTFICFHNEKYPQNQRKIAVIQVNQQLTQKYLKKISFNNEKDIHMNHNQIQKWVEQQIWYNIPEQIRNRFKITKKCLGFYYWPQSLLKPRPQIKGKQQCLNKFNYELNKKIVSQNQQKNLYFTGDYLNNKSRVTGSIAMGIKVSQQLLLEHFNIDKKQKL